MACERCNVWQHSACLGISQSDAEKDDFHFVCDTCKRREEDAKKPKIPSLKFRVGPSASPPEQNPQVVIPPPIESKIRPLDPSSGFGQAAQRLNGPPVQMFRPPQASVNGSQTARVPHYPGQAVSNTSPPVKHTQHGSANGSIQPRLQYPHHPAEAVNGYRPPPQTFQPRQYLPNGYTQSGSLSTATHQSTGFHGYRNDPAGSGAGQSSPPPITQPGWSARYVPPTTEQSVHHSRGLPPSYQDPSRSRPEVHHTSQTPMNYPAQVRPQPSHPSSSTTTFPPPQTPHFISASRLSASATPHVNGYAVHNTPSNQPVGPPSVSPVKHASPSNGHTTPFTVAPSATPLSRPPSFPADQVATSPGYSPVKHDSPKAQEGPVTLGQMSNVTALPPIAKLAPSPVSHNAGIPLKIAPAAQATDKLPTSDLDRSGEAS